MHIGADALFFWAQPPMKSGSCGRFALSQPRMPYSCLLLKAEIMVRLPVLCPHCPSGQVITGGKTTAGQQRSKPTVSPLTIPLLYY